MSRRVPHLFVRCGPRLCATAATCLPTPHSPTLSPQGRGGLCLAAGGWNRTPGLGKGWGQILSATLSRAERARGLAVNSASDGRTGRRVTMRRVARWPQVQTGCWGGQIQSLDSTLKNDFTKRSSSEWKLIVAIRPPGLSIPRAAFSPASISPNSSLTAMRMPWKVRVATLMSRGQARRGMAASTAEARSVVGRRGRAARHDELCDPPRPTLLAVIAQDPLELSDVELVDDARCIERRGGVHPHVQRPLTAEAESALRGVERAPG